MTKSKLQKVYFDLYDQLQPDIAEKAKKNWDYEFARQYGIPKDMRDALSWGFLWDANDNVRWAHIDWSIQQNLYPLNKPKPIQPEWDNKRRTMTIDVDINEDEISVRVGSNDKWSSLELHALKSLILQNIDDVIRKRNQQTKSTE